MLTDTGSNTPHDHVTHPCKMDKQPPRCEHNLSVKIAPHSCSMKQHSMACNLTTLEPEAAQHSTAQNSTAQHSAAQRSTAQHSAAPHLKNLIQALGRERSERHLCQLVIQAGSCRFGQVIQHCQAPQQASHFHRANSLQGHNTSYQLDAVAHHTDLPL